jgi:acyl-coenzyme A thioesterase 13
MPSAAGARSLSTAARRVGVLAAHTSAAAVQHPFASSAAAVGGSSSGVGAARAFSAPAHGHGHGHSHAGSSDSSAAAGGAATPGQPRSQSFIDRVKAFGANAMLGAFINTGAKFDRVLDGMSVTHMGDGRVTCELDVREGLHNSYATLHGGAIATLVDVVGTMALLSQDATRAGVSVDLSVTFTAAAKAGEKVRIEGRVLKTGKRLGFTQVGG